MLKNDFGNEIYFTLNEFDAGSDLMTANGDKVGFKSSEILNYWESAN